MPWVFIGKGQTIGGGTGDGGGDAVQFRHSNVSTSGSNHFTYLTSSVPHTLFVTGNVVVSGTLTANTYRVNVVDTSYGSTTFGNSVADLHQFTGSLQIYDTGEQQRWSYDANSYASIAVADASHTTLAIAEAGGFEVTAGGDISLTAGGNVFLAAAGGAGTTSTLGNTTLGDSAARVTTVTGRLTGSQGAYFAEKVAIGYSSGMASQPAKSLEIIQASGHTYSYLTTYSDTDAHRSRLILRKSSGTDPATPAATADDEELGEITFYGVNSAGTPAFVSSARISAHGDATPGSSHAPGRIVFSTAGASEAETERMRIDSTGLSLKQDGAVLKFGANEAVTFTHASPSTLNINIPGGCEFDSSEGSLMFGNALASGQTLKLGADGAVQVTIAPHDTAGSELFNVHNNAGTAVNAIALTASAGGIALSASLDMTFDANGGQFFYNDDGATHFLMDCDNTAFTIYDDQDTGDFFKIQVAQHGATTISTTDDDSNDDADLTLDADGKIVIEAKAGDEVVFNEGGADVDFRVEGGSETHLLFVDAGNERVSIGNSSDSPAATLEVTNQASSDNVALVQLNHLDVDQIALDINAANTAAAVMHLNNTAANDQAVVLIESEAAETNPLLELKNSHVSTDKPAILSFFRSDASAEADDMSIGTIRFDGFDSGDAKQAYASIEAIASDVTAGDEGGKLTFKAFAGGTAGTAAAKNLLSIGGEDVANATVPEVVVNEDAIDCDFRVEGVGSAAALFVQGSDGKVGVGINASLDAPFTVYGNNAGKNAANFMNDGNNANRYGIGIIAGADDASGVTYYMMCHDGDVSGTDGTGLNIGIVGYIENNNGTFRLVDPSDRRLKKNIKNTKVKGLETVNAMKVRDFQLKKNNLPKTGFIAQELETVYPAAVSKPSPDAKMMGGMMGVSKETLIPVLVKAIQELSAEVEALKAKAGTG